MVWLSWMIAPLGHAQSNDFGGMMPFYRGVFLIFGWLIALGLMTGTMTYYVDGHESPEMKLLGFALLALWIADIARMLRDK